MARRGLPRGAMVLFALLVAAVVSVNARPAAAQPISGARMVYLADGDPPVSWSANADGSDRVRLAKNADQLEISPDGELVALTEDTGADTSLVVASSGDPAGTAPATRPLLRAKDLVLMTWAPDGSKLAVLADGRLVVVDIASDTKHVIAGGLIENASFSPSGDQLVYDRLTAPRYSYLVQGRVSSLTRRPSCSDLFIADADGSQRYELTRDGLSSDPLWGPQQIAFSRARECSRSGGEDFPSQLWLTRSNGHGVHPLTHLRLPRASLGLAPTAWSDDGRRLLAEYSTRSEIGFVSRLDGAWAVEVPSGRAHRLSRHGSRASLISGAGLSHDGSTVLATYTRVGLDRLRWDSQSIVTIPWQGGPRHVLVHNASTPSWSR
jgi:hypothetical protein